MLCNFLKVLKIIELKRRNLQFEKDKKHRFWEPNFRHALDSIQGPRASKPIALPIRARWHVFKLEKRRSFLGDANLFDTIMQ